MGLERKENKHLKNNRSSFQGSEFKTRAYALDWINSEIDAANSVPDLKAHVKKFEINIVNTVFSLMGME